MLILTRAHYKCQPSQAQLIDSDQPTGRSDEAEREPRGLLSGWVGGLVLASGDAVDALAALGIEEVEPLGIDCDLERLALVDRRAA
jgi:hypothetical protein